MLSRSFFTSLVMALGLLGLVACGASSRTGPSYGGAFSTPGQPADLLVGKQPARPYAAKGVVETVQTNHESAAEVLERMRWMAARRGCDAVIFLSAKDTVIGRRGWFLTRKGFRGSCVVYTSEPRQRAALAKLEPPAAARGPAVVASPPTRGDHLDQAL